MGKVGQAWKERENRRQGMRRVPVNSLQQRVRCWKCGQMGHMSRSCPQNAQSAVRPTYFTLDFVTLPVSEEVVAPLLDSVPTSFFTEASKCALVDTGAVHALIGLDQFMELDAHLAELGLGVVKVTAPTCVAGVGGKTTTLAGVRVPVALAGLPGVLSMVIVPGAIPALMPLPAMAKLGAVIDTCNALIHWPHGQSALKRMWSGHLALALTEGLEAFESSHPEGHLFKRSEDHVALVNQICSAAQQKSKVEQPGQSLLLHDVRTKNKCDLIPAEEAQVGNEKESIGTHGASETSGEGGADGKESCGHKQRDGIHTCGSRQYSVMEETGNPSVVGLGGCKSASCGGRAEDISSPTAICSADGNTIPGYAPSSGPTGIGAGPGAVGSIIQHAVKESTRVSSCGSSSPGEQTHQMVGLQGVSGKVPQRGTREPDTSGLNEPSCALRGRGLQQARWHRRKEVIKRRDSAVWLATAEYMSEEWTALHRDEASMLDAAYLQLVPGSKVSVRSSQCKDLVGVKCQYYGYLDSGEIVDSREIPTKPWNGVAIKVPDDVCVESVQVVAAPTMQEASEVWNLIVAKQIARYAVPGGEVLVHGSQSNLQVPDELLSHCSNPYRVSVLRMCDGSIQCQIDLWVSQGRRKRERKIGDGVIALATVFVCDHDRACKWKVLLENSASEVHVEKLEENLDLSNVVVPCLHSIVPLCATVLDDACECWTWARLLEEVYQQLQN
eukprot:6481866-Amphidinium_carterae.1